MIQIPSDFKEFLKLLHANNVDYLLVGGYAVSFHGYPRATIDMDIWVAITPSNAEKIVETLVAFGFGSNQIPVELFLNENQILRMGVPPLRLEILTTIDGVNFSDCFKNRIVDQTFDFPINLISRKDLLINKRASGRYKDLNDLEQLDQNEDNKY